MEQTSGAASLLNRVRTRLQVAAFAKAFSISLLILAALGILTILAVRLLGLVPPSQQRPLLLAVLPAAAVLCAVLFHRRISRQTAARAVDNHADTRDLFLTLSSLDTSAGEYQPLVTSSAEEKANRVEATAVVPFRFGRDLMRLTGIAAVLALTVWLTPQLDPFGHVEAATRAEKEQQEIDNIRRDTIARADRLKKESERAAEEAEEIDSEISQLKKDFRQMQPTKVESNARVLDVRRQELGEMWKAAAGDEQLRRMMNQPISQQQLGGTRSEKLNEWLKELQEGKTESLQQELQKARETMEAMLAAKSEEERQKLASKLSKELQDLEKFSRDKAGSRELTSALSKAMKSLEVCRRQSNDGEMSRQAAKDAMEALKESLNLSEQELDQVAQAASDLKKLEDALKTLQQAQKLNQNQKLDGSQCEGCESLEDYAELYAQMMGEGGGGDKDRNEGGGRGVGRGGETPEDDSDPEGYKKEKEKPQIQAGKMLLSIKTKEYAEEKDFDPEKMREYQQGLRELKTGVQSAIDSEEIPPGYIEGIKGYFDKIENVDPSPATKE
ncbi:MAG: hypothetical protein KDA89_23425 [Planctomycetaceae bacterium]|nr:hypothetical protein [Planctomycetaceae bacterium]